MVKFTAAINAALFAVLTASSVASSTIETRELQDLNLVETVVGSDELTTLETLVINAELVETLSGDGPFTVLAPYDDAFASVPPKYTTADFLPHLKEILLFHVASGDVRSTALTDGMKVMMANEEEVTVSITNGTVTFGPALGGSAKVVMADVAASNGVAHVIDAVLTPSFLTVNIPQLATAANLSTLVTAVVEAGLAEVLASSDSAFTVLAPTNEAFAALPDGTLESLLADKEALAEILKYHVFSGIISSGDLVDGDVATLTGKALTVSVGDTVTFSGKTTATVISADVLANNGIVHVIDTVLLPPDNATAVPTMAPTEEASSAFSMRSTLAAAAAMFSMVVAM